MPRNRMKLRCQAGRYFPPKDVWEPSRQTVVEIVNQTTAHIWREDHDLLYTQGPWVIFGVLPDTPKWRLQVKDWKTLLGRLVSRDEVADVNNRT